MSKLKFILSDESVNRYGFRILVSEESIEEFRKNPLLFYGHNSWDMPLGKWDNIKIETLNGNKVITAEPVFDKNDPKAIELKRKIEDGMLSAASIGFDPIETSSDKKYLLSGQTRPTVTRARIIEASIVNTPANQSAYRLSHDIHSIKDIDKILPILNMDISKIATTIGLSADADEATVLKELDKLKQSKENFIELSNRLKKLEDNSKPNNDADEVAKLQNKITELELKLNSDKGSIVDAIKQLSGQNTADDSNNRDKWTHLQWSQNDPAGLLEIKKKEPSKYNEIIKRK